MFTPVESAAGGMIIGASVAVTLLVSGKIAGISGIFGPMLRNAFIVEMNWNSFKFQVLFVSGLVVGGLINLAFNREFAFPAVLELADSVQASVILYALGGLFVGAGTRSGAGCTSGHGLCGLARVSPRSLVAVCTFMGTAAVTVFVKRLATETIDVHMAKVSWPDSFFTMGAVLFTLVLVPLAFLFPRHDLHAPLIAGTLFGLGLGCAGMTNQAKVIGFLDVAGTWDPSLAFVMGGGLCITVPSFAYARSAGVSPVVKGAEWEKPGPGGSHPLSVAWSKPDLKMILGSVSFGIGWGLTGLCPGPLVATVIPSIVVGSSHGVHLAFCFPLFLLAFCVSWLTADRLIVRMQALAPVDDGTRWQAF